jgi:hypothetical protein
LEESLEREAALQERLDKLVQERMDQLAERSERSKKDSSLDDDSMTNSNQSQRQISVFNENLVTLDAIVNRKIILAFINQYRAGDLQKDPLQLIFSDARAIISKKFVENRDRDCNTRAEWLSWSKEKLFQTLEKRYRSENIADNDTLSRLRDCKLRIYFANHGSAELNKLVVKIWRIIDDMTPEELGDPKLQAQFIKMFFNNLSNKEPSKPTKDRDRPARTAD